ncbi:MAG TPA: hypothetical protein VGG42_09875 [Acidobacteriaceae bacterium]
MPAKPAMASPEDRLRQALGLRAGEPIPEQLMQQVLAGDRGPEMQKMGQEAKAAPGNSMPGRPDSQQQVPAAKPPMDDARRFFGGRPSAAPPPPMANGSGGQDMSPAQPGMDDDDEDDTNGPPNARAIFGGRR